MKTLPILLPLLLMGCVEKPKELVINREGGTLIISTNDPAASCAHAYMKWEEWKATGVTCSFSQVRYCETCNAMQLRWIQGKAFVQP